MVLANVPVVILGDRMGARLPIKVMRITAAAVFGLLGVLTITGFG